MNRLIVVLILLALLGLGMIAWAFGWTAHAVVDFVQEPSATAPTSTPTPTLMLTATATAIATPTPTATLRPTSTPAPTLAQ